MSRKFTYDPAGRTKDDSFLLSGTKTITTSYDAGGRVVAKTWPDNDTSSFTYDGAGRVIAVASPEGRGYGDSYRIY